MFLFCSKDSSFAGAGQGEENVFEEEKNSTQRIVRSLQVDDKPQPRIREIRPHPSSPKDSCLPEVIAQHAAP
jgi:hypothetical protein